MGTVTEKGGAATNGQPGGTPIVDIEMHLKLYPIVAALRSYAAPNTNGNTDR